MKKITKILSSVLAASMVISAFAMNAFAASKAHTVTINADKTTALAAGDTVTVELTVDNTEKLVSFDYSLVFDASVFSIDTAKANRVEKCIDKTWLDGIKDTDGDWGYYLGSPTYKADATGKFNFQWAGSEGVEAEYAIDNRVVGKFYLTVNEGVANGTTATFSLTGNSMDAGETLPTALTCAPVTVTVGTPALEKEDVVIAAPAVQKSEEANGVYNAGFLADFTVDADANNAVKAVKFTVNNGSDNAETTVELGTTVEAGTVKVALNILNVTAGVELTTTVAPIAE